MVKLTKIYTRSGDSGTTALGSGERVAKDDLRVEAYGCVDETNAAIGVAISNPEGVAGEGPIRACLARIQHDLFDLGADLCVPIKDGEDRSAMLRITPEQVDRLEDEIDRFNESLGDLTSFVLPSGTALAAGLHLARTICRRAERRVATLMSEQGASTSGDTLRYLNRLSDLLFVLARAANAAGEGDVLWVPGAGREG